MDGKGVSNGADAAPAGGLSGDSIWSRESAIFNRVCGWFIVLESACFLADTCEYAVFGQVKSYFGASASDRAMCDQTGIEGIDGQGCPVYRTGERRILANSTGSR